jgi:hypothetical protein
LTKNVVCIGGNGDSFFVFDFSAKKDSALKMTWSRQGQLMYTQSLELSPDEETSHISLPT